MLYVFHVDTGRMIKFDMNVALTSVQNLKDIIEKRHGLPADKVVLLVSGGEMLTANSLVCSYSAGTDTNPIYMFTTIDIKPQPWPSIEPGNFSDNELVEQVERCLSLPSAQSTIVASAQLGQQFYDLAIEEETICGTLVHEQHLQQQGWSAVIANMEDLTEEFRQRFETFSKCFENHLSKRGQHLDLLQNFNQDLLNLSKIPILPGLLPNAEEEFHGFDEYFKNDDVFSQSTQANSVILQSNNENKEEDKNIDDNDITCTSPESQDDGEANQNRTVTITSSGSSSVVEQKRPRLSKENTPDINAESKLNLAHNKGLFSGRNLTLLQWISAKENHDTLRTMAEECSQGLSTFTPEKYQQLKNEVYNIIKYAEQEEIKEIKGLEDRLSGLEKLMFNIRKLVQEQGGHSCALQQSQSRTSRLSDPSILPDLCESHRGQLKNMLSNHKQIRDYRRRISKAKDELGTNLNKRLKYIIQIENAMSERDHSLLFYHRCQRRIERHVNIIQQIHQAPKVYIAAVAEVVRRRIFSGEFVKWASNLACDFDAIRSQEVERRREFNANFEGHFLNILFPGMSDMPPAFANENPILFDSCLPNITKNDIDVLTTFLPDISDSIPLPDMRNVIDFFISRSGHKNCDEEIPLAQNELNKETNASYHPIDSRVHLKDGFESETDTEEFEKLSDKIVLEKLMGKQEKMVLGTSNIKDERITLSTTSKKADETVMFNKSTETEAIINISIGITTEENLATYEEEIAKQKNFLKCMSQLFNNNIQFLRENLKTIKEDQIEANTDINQKLNQFLKVWDEVQEICESERQRLNDQITTFKCENKNLSDELCDYKDEVEQLKNERHENKSSHLEQIECIEKESMQLRQTLAVRSEEIEQLQNNLKEAEIEKEKALQIQKEKLMHEHKTELESLRCRFKIMTSMERSPSDTSLEKIEKSDMIDISCHESILCQTREDLNIEKEMAVQKAREAFNIEKEKAIEEAIALERLKWEQSNSSNQNMVTMVANVDLLKKMIEEKDKQLNEMQEQELLRHKEICQLKMKIESTALGGGEESDRTWMNEKIDFLNRHNLRQEQELNLLKKIIEEKDKQLNEMREQELLRSKEICQLKLKIDTALTSDEESDRTWMKEKIDFLSRHNHRLEQELSVEKERSKKLEMESSISAMKYSNMEQSMSRSKASSSSTLRQMAITTDSCSPGDLVFVVWNVKHRQFVIVQESPNLFFVHADSLSPLNLKLPATGDIHVPIPFFTIAKVINKEFCQARKDENRYKVLKGTKFFRVKLQPMTEMKWHLRREKLDSFASSGSSTSVTRSTSTQYLVDSFAQTEINNSSKEETNRQENKEMNFSTAEINVDENPQEKIKVFQENEPEDMSRASTSCYVKEIVPFEEEPIKQDLAQKDEDKSEQNISLTEKIENIEFEKITDTNNEILPSLTTKNQGEKDLNEDESDEYRSLEIKEE